MNTRTASCTIGLSSIIAVGGAIAAVDRSTPTSPRPAVASSSPQDVRAAVELALPYLARQTASWIEQKKCTSCHQVPYALWGMNMARERGFAVDDRLAKWNRWSVTFVLDKARNEAWEHADELHEMLRVGSIEDVAPEFQPDGQPVSSRLASILSGGQGEDGYWHAGGQLPGQRRLRQETDEATTMWSLLALRSIGSYQQGAERTKPPIASVSTSTEHLMLRYLLALGSPESAEVVELQHQILDHQNDDGGWGWLMDGASDAMATGQALYAVSFMKPEDRKEPVQAAHRFLAQSQRADGSWSAPSTLEEKGGQSYVVSDDWGTAWAVIGLIRTMDPL